MATKLTDLAVKSAKIGMHWDLLTTGLGLKVTDTGKRVWIMQLVWPGQSSQSRRTLGRYPGMSLDDARKLAGQWYALAKTGTDPRQAQEDKRHASKLAQLNTFGATAEAYIAGRTSKRRAHKDALAIRRDLISAWGDRPVSSITPRDVRLHIAEVAKRGPYSAVEAWTHCVGIFKFAVFEELITASPCASFTKKQLLANHRIGPRQRVLSENEIVALWQVASELGHPEGSFYKWLLLTGCRVTEGSGARWAEFDTRTWTVPAERFKSDQVNIVPLTDAMQSFLSSLPRNGPWLFSHDGNSPMNSWSNLKEKVDERMLATLGRLAPWVNHDLRRVVRTNLSALGVDDHVAEMVLGHGRKGLQRVYDRHTYQPQILSALNAWQAKLGSIV